MQKLHTPTGDAYAQRWETLLNASVINGVRERTKHTTLHETNSRVHGIIPGVGGWERDSTVRR